MKISTYAIMSAMRRRGIARVDIKQWLIDFVQAELDMDIEEGKPIDVRDLLNTFEELNSSLDRPNPTLEY